MVQVAGDWQLYVGVILKELLKLVLGLFFSIGAKSSQWVNPTSLCFRLYPN